MGLHRRRGGRTLCALQMASYHPLILRDLSGSRTRNLLLRRQLLYPIELPGRITCCDNTYCIVPIVISKIAVSDNSILANAKWI